MRMSSEMTDQLDSSSTTGILASWKIPSIPDYRQGNPERGYLKRCMLVHLFVRIPVLGETLHPIDESKELSKFRGELSG